MSFSETVKSSVRKRAHHTCCLCKQPGPIEVHHIIPREENGPDTEDNAAPLCPTCHETYGTNPTKRRFIREVRDSWYEICATRFAADGDRIEELANLMRKAVTLDQFNQFKEELIELIKGHGDFLRSQAEILHAVDELFDKIWYDRHQSLKTSIMERRTTVKPDIWRQAEDAARGVENKYGKSALGPWSDFEWGMLNGKLSALRWVLGDEWDFLDT